MEDKSEQSLQEQTYVYTPPEQISHPEISHFAIIKDRIEGLREWMKTKLSSPKILFLETLREAKLSTTEDQARDFLSRVRLYLKKAKTQSIDSESYKKVQISCDEFVGLILTWCLDHKISPEDRTKTLDEKLKESIIDYKDFKQVCKDKEVDEIIAFLEGKLNRKSVKARFKISKKYMVGLKEIFNFYSKQMLMLGPHPTFETIKQRCNMLDLGKYLKFCRHFAVMSANKNASESRHLIQKVFMSHSVNQQMDFDNFIDSLTELRSLQFGNPDTHIYKFFDFLECDNPALFIPKMKQATLPFHTNGPSRISSDDISRKYKIDPKKQIAMKERVNKWKTEKKLSKIQSVPNIVRKSIRFSPKRASGFTWQRLLNMSPREFREALDFVESGDSDDSILKMQYPGKFK